MISYEKKYLKYKMKYLNLKNEMKGGGGNTKRPRSSTLESEDAELSELLASMEEEHSRPTLVNKTH